MLSSLIHRALNRYFSARARFAPLLSLCALMAACASSAPPPLEDAVSAFHRAVERGDAEALYKLQTSAGRAARTQEEIAELLTLHREELQQIARRLQHQQAKVEARLIIDGETLSLVYEGGDYKLSGAILGGVSLSDPASLTLALRRALMARDLNALLRLLTNERRAAVLAQINALAEESTDPLEMDIEVLDKNATVKLPSGVVLLLEYEDGEWRLFDLRL